MDLTELSNTTINYRTIGVQHNLSKYELENNDVVISIVFQRNITDFMFLTQYSTDKKALIGNFIKNIILTNQDFIDNEFSEISENTYSSKKMPGVVLNVNKSDSHIVIAIEGTNMQKIISEYNEIEAILHRNFNLSYEDSFGYLNSNIYKLGYGLKLSAVVNSNATEDIAKSSIAHLIKQKFLVNVNTKDSKVTITKRFELSDNIVRLIDSFYFEIYAFNQLNYTKDKPLTKLNFVNEINYIHFNKIIDAYEESFENSKYSNYPGNLNINTITESIVYKNGHFSRHALDYYFDFVNLCLKKINNNKALNLYKFNLENFSNFTQFNYTFEVFTQNHIFKDFTIQITRMVDNCYQSSNDIENIILTNQNDQVTVKYDELSNMIEFRLNTDSNAIANIKHALIGLISYVNSFIKSCNEIKFKSYNDFGFATNNLNNFANGLSVSLEIYQESVSEDELTKLSAKYMFSYIKFNDLYLITFFVLNKYLVKIARDMVDVINHITKAKLAAIDVSINNELKTKNTLKKMDSEIIEN